MRLSYATPQQRQVPPQQPQVLTVHMVQKNGDVATKGVMT